MKKIKSFRANTNAESVKSLAIHPTQSYMLSVSANCANAKLWDWNRGWECIQTFMTEYSAKLMFVFNPIDITIASASKRTVKIWAPDSSESKYTLSGHSKTVNCLEFFTRDHHQYLITGSDDCTAKIWDMQKKMCVHTLEAFTSNVISVSSSQNLPILFTCSWDGVVHVWNSANFRVEQVLQIHFPGDVCRLSCLMGPRRAVIRHDEEISAMYIGNVGCETGSTYLCEHQLNVDSVLGNKTSEAIGSSSLLDVHLMSDSLELINNTDESVAFEVMGMGGIVSAKSTYTLIGGFTEGAILKSSISGDRYVPFKDKHECSEFFEEAKEIGNAVHELALEAIFARQGETLFPAIPPVAKFC